MPVVVPPPVSCPPRSERRPSGPRRPSAPPLRPAAVAGLALLLALASLAEPPADAPVGAAPTGVGVEAPGEVTPSAWRAYGQSVVPAVDAAVDAAAMDEAAMDEAAMDEAGIDREPVAAVDGAPVLLRTAAGAEMDAPALALRLGARLVGGIAGPLTGVVVADPSGAARPAPGGAPVARDTLLLDHQ